MSNTQPRNTRPGLSLGPIRIDAETSAMLTDLGEETGHTPSAVAAVLLREAVGLPPLPSLIEKIRERRDHGQTPAGGNTGV